MKLFAGTLLFQTTLPEKLPELDIDILRISQNGLYIMGGLEQDQSFSEIISLLKNTLGEIRSQDISIEEDDMLEILLEEFEAGVFESVSFEGPEVSFEGLLERFSETDSVIALREVEASEKFGNRVIRVDFLY